MVILHGAEKLVTKSCSAVEALFADSKTDLKWEIVFSDMVSEQVVSDESRSFPRWSFTKGSTVVKKKFLKHKNKLWLFKEIN